MTNKDFKILGKGEPKFIAVHGWGDDNSTFDPIEKYIPEHLSILCPNLPGYGGLEPPNEWTVESISKNLVKFLEERTDLKNKIFIGNCFGAVPILEMLIRKYISPTKIIIIDPYAFIPFYFKIFLAGKFGERAYKTTFDSRIGRFITNFALKNHRTDESDLTKSFSKVDHDSVHKYLKLMSKISGPEKYKDINVEIKILFGENSFGAVKKSAWILKELWQDKADLYEIPNSGHLPLQENPKKLSEIIFKNE